MEKKRRSKRPSNLYHPLYWPSWVAVGAMRLLASLPYRVQLQLGRWLGLLLRLAHAKRRETVVTNLAACFPELSQGERERLAARCFESLGMALSETALAWWAPDLRSCCECRIVGVDHITAALANGRGVILCSAHLHTAELAGRFMAFAQDVSIVFRPQNDRVIEAVAHRRRALYYANMIHYRDMRGMVKALRRNEVVWYAPDIDAGTKRSLFAPFFGVAAASLTATARLARLTGAAVVPCFYFRQPNCGGYEIHVDRALDDYPSGDGVADAARINGLIEAAVRRHPEQYLWQHRRFKTRPPGEAGLYGTGALRK
jgi:KDO2-lipid IV(A) lauroyltransferase